ncbi:hypothetical protein TYRP_009665 [Tyrophagus putrescentiae]|nr:hypothetical protein TYRP_009665 [Tyrophagus putrescentiae]
MIGPVACLPGSRFKGPELVVVVVMVVQRKGYGTMTLTGLQLNDYHWREDWQATKRIDQLAFFVHFIFSIPSPLLFLVVAIFVVS